MSNEAKDLRELAWKLEDVTRASRAYSMAWEYVRHLSDYLTLRAKCIELGDELRRRDAEAEELK
jgi:hypothetical protein